jgi:hypothetical protein
MESTVIVFSDVLLHLTRVGQPLEPGDADQIAALCKQDIALVVCSEQSAGEVKRIQNVLGLLQPMICDGGETVVVPQGCGASGDGYPYEERVIRCRPLTGAHEKTDGAGATGDASRYQRGVAVIVGLFGRAETPVMTLALTDPTRPDNLLALVDHTIFVGADDGARGALQVADWVAAIADVAEQLRSERRRLAQVSRRWLASPQAPFRPSVSRIGGYRFAPGGARPN